MRHPSLSIVLLIVCFAGPAKASMLFERLPADPFTAGTFFSDAQRPREAATPFAVDACARLDALAWWGDYFASGALPGDGVSPFAIRIFADDAGAPSAEPLHEILVEASVASLGGSVPSWAFAASLPGELSLPGGVPLWISILDRDPTRPDFAWRKATEAGTSFSRGAATGWVAAPGLGSFRLEGEWLAPEACAVATPEPSAAVLSVLGLVGLAAGRSVAQARPARR